jgi:hypothetical protein
VVTSDTSYTVSTGRMGSKWTFGRLVGGGMVSPGSRWESLAGSCECSDEQPLGSGTTELVS